MVRFVSFAVHPRALAWCLVVRCVWVCIVLLHGVLQCTASIAHCVSIWRVACYKAPMQKMYWGRGSNSRPLACEASVIATRPTQPCSSPCHTQDRDKDTCSGHAWITACVQPSPAVRTSAVLACYKRTISGRLQQTDTAPGLWSTQLLPSSVAYTFTHKSMAGCRCKDRSTVGRVTNQAPTHLPGTIGVLDAGVELHLPMSDCRSTAS